MLCAGDVVGKALADEDADEHGDGDGSPEDGEGAAVAELMAGFLLGAGADDEQNLGGAPGVEENEPDCVHHMTSEG